MKAKSSRIQRIKEGKIVAEFNYVKVADRIKELHTDHANRFPTINTELLSPFDADMVVVKATVEIDREEGSSTRLRFSAHSQARWSDASNFVNKMSALENAETSAVGRALAMMNIGLIDDVASSNEMQKSGYTPRPQYDRGTTGPASQIPTATSAPVKSNAPTQPQLSLIQGLAKELNTTAKVVNTREEASAEITRLQSMRNPA